MPLEDAVDEKTCMLGHRGQFVSITVGCVCTPSTKPAEKRLLKAQQMNLSDLEEATVIRTEENNANMK